MPIVRETGKPIAQVARDLGISEATPGNWVNKDRAGRGRTPAGSCPRMNARELGRLRRENAQLAMERDVLIGLVG